MKIKPILTQLIALPLMLGLLSITSPVLSATKIMPLGDSITGSPGCWRAYLWQKLQTGGYTNLDFVGTLGPQGCSVTHDGDNEGRGGILATNIANQNQLPAWLSATKPDIVLMHLGTNDVWSNRATADILMAFTTLVQQMRASNANMKIIVAKIIPMDSARSCSGCADGVIALNNALPAWANGLTTSASPITLADQWTGFSTSADTSDGVHPTDAGHKKMAEKWYPLVTAALNSGTSTSSAASSRASTAASSAASGTGSQCNWYSNIFPLCATTTSGWGFENNVSCVARADCAALPSPYGVIGTTTSIASSSKAASSSSASSKATSSIASSSKAATSIATSSRAASSAATGTGSVSCTYVVSNSWSTGFAGAIRVSNGGTTTKSGWTATWQYAGANRITSSWNATVTGSNPYSATNLSWNGNLAAGQSVEFGFQGNTNGSAIELPVVTCK